MDKPSVTLMEIGWFDLSPELIKVNNKEAKVYFDACDRVLCETEDGYFSYNRTEKTLGKFPSEKKFFEVLLKLEAFYPPTVIKDIKTEI